VPCRVPGLSVSFWPQVLRRSSDGAMTIPARQRHTHAVVRGDVSVRDGARRRSSGPQRGSAGARLKGTRSTGIVLVSGAKPEQRKEDVFERNGRGSGSGA
jgi:hypothetical protein